MPPEDFNNERARISKQRDDIMDIMTQKFKEHVANDDMNRCHNNGLCYQSTSYTKDKICISSKGYTGENCTK